MRGCTVDKLPAGSHLYKRFDADIEGRAGKDSEGMRHELEVLSEAICHRTEAPSVSLGVARLPPAAIGGRRRRVKSPRARLAL